MIDRFLNSITMYNLMHQGLRVVAAYAVAASILGYLDYSVGSLLGSMIVIMIACWVLNLLFAKIFRAPVNQESAYITGMILFFLLSPATSLNDYLVLTLASAIAMASKYLLAIHKRHIFNPAAFGAFVIGLTGLTGGTAWWGGIPVMFPAIAIFGFLILRKIKRFQMFFTFIIVASLSAMVFSFKFSMPVIEMIEQLLTTWPLIFFGTIMFTEPLTTPPTKKLQLIYATLVGFLFGFPFQIGTLYATAELALLLGNIFSFAVSFKRRVILSFQNKIALAKNTYELTFKPDTRFAFNPGQYLEWTLPHYKIDSRGNRRYFTIASSPTEDTVKLGIRFSDTKSSSFKQKLLQLNAGDKIYAGQLTGDFTLPKNSNEKLAFIAGGIGITPFKSMLQYLMDKNEKRDIVLLYANKTQEEVAYTEFLNEAQNKIGLKTIHVIAKFIDEPMIRQDVSDFKDRIFYLSGPPAMVENYKKLLSKLGVKRIKTDFFPGY